MICQKDAFLCGARGVQISVAFQKKVGVALFGPKNDKSFNQAAYQGILVAQKANPNIKLTSTLENKATDAQRTDAVNTLAPLNNVVLGVSASFNKLDCIGKHVLQDLGEEGAVCHDISIERASRYPCAALTKLVRPDGAPADTGDLAAELVDDSIEADAQSPDEPGPGDSEGEAPSAPPEAEHL